MLTQAEITAMQATQNLAMPGVVTISRYTMASDGMGGQTQTWANVGTVAGRIYFGNSRAFAERVAGEQVVSKTSWYATLPVGTVLTAKDRLTYGGRVWEVIQVNNSEMWQTAVRAELSSLNEPVDVSTFAYVFDFSQAAHSQYLACL